MKTLLLTALIGLMSAPALAKDSPDVPAGAKLLYSFIGKFKGTATLANAGQPTIVAKGFQRCEKVARGWAIQCEAHFEGDGLIFDEAIMGGYDVPSQTIHWNVVNSFGQAYTLVGTFTNPDTLELEYTATVDGQPYVDQGTWTISPNKKRIRLDQVITLGGQVVTTITADLKK